MEETTGTSSEQPLAGQESAEAQLEPSGCWEQQEPLLRGYLDSEIGPLEVAAVVLGHFVSVDLIPGAETGAEPWECCTMQPAGQGGHQGALLQCEAVGLLLHPHTPADWQRQSGLGQFEVFGPRIEEHRRMSVGRR